MSWTVRGWAFASVILSALWLVGCQQENEQETVEHQPVAIHSGQECSMCGMIIEQFPGPKGQLFVRGHEHPMAFCSTRDLFAYALQEEHKHRVQSVFVHDSKSAPWEQMAKAKYIDGQSAFYVVGHSQLGAMGPTLASFKSKAEAEHFMHQYGGRVMSYQEISRSTLNEMNHMEMHPHSHH